MPLLIDCLVALPSGLCIVITRKDSYPISNGPSIITRWWRLILLSAKLLGQVDSGWLWRVLIKREHLAPTSKSAVAACFHLRFAHRVRWIGIQHVVTWHHHQHLSSLIRLYDDDVRVLGHHGTTTCRICLAFGGGSVDRSIVGCIVDSLIVIFLEGDNNNFFFRNSDDTHTRSNWCYFSTVIVCRVILYLWHGPIKRSNCEWGVGVSKDGGVSNQIKWLIHFLFVVKAINLSSQHLPPPTNWGRCARLCLVGNVNVMMPRIYNFNIPDILIDEMGHHCAIIIISCHDNKEDIYLIERNGILMPKTFCIIRLILS